MHSPETRPSARSLQQSTGRLFLALVIFSLSLNLQGDQYMKVIAFHGRPRKGENTELLLNKGEKKEGR
jgi:hypothetical protein